MGFFDGLSGTGLIAAITVVNAGKAESVDRSIFDREKY